MVKKMFVLKIGGEIICSDDKYIIARTILANSGCGYNFQNACMEHEKIFGRGKEVREEAYKSGMDRKFFNKYPGFCRIINEIVDCGSGEIIEGRLVFRKTDGEMQIQTGCRSAQFDSDSGHWQCLISRDECIFLIPNVNACKEMYGTEEKKFWVDLPPELQEIYDSLNLTKEQFEVLDGFFERALVAIENEGKYESALSKMRVFVQNCYCCIYEENSMKCARANGCDEEICRKGIIAYFKNKAGFENVRKPTVIEISPEDLKKITGQKWRLE